jgi:hypothetical protein
MKEGAILQGATRIDRSFVPCGADSRIFGLTHGLRPFDFAQGKLWAALFRRFAAASERHNFGSKPRRPTYCCAGGCCVGVAEGRSLRGET